jgi:hypothetical protein
MPLCQFRGDEIDESVPLRSRYELGEDSGRISAKRHPVYVYSVTPNSCLMHRIAAVEIYWDVLVNGSTVGRLKTPRMMARTICGMTKFLFAQKSRTCQVPLPDSVLCGRCHGEVATFGKSGAGTKAGLTRKVARIKLGCEIAGYPSAVSFTRNMEGK